MSEFKDLRDRKDKHEKLLDNETSIDDFIWEEEDDDEGFLIIQKALDNFSNEIDNAKNRTLTTKRLTKILYFLLKLIYNHNIDIKELYKNTIKYAKRDGVDGMYR